MYSFFSMTLCYFILESYATYFLFSFKTCQNQSSVEFEEIFLAFELFRWLVIWDISWHSRRKKATRKKLTNIAQLQMREKNDVG